MKSWKDNNMSSILEYPFDFEGYIEERLREIQDLDERRFAREVLLNGLGRLIRCVEKKYKELEQRVLAEFPAEESRYEVAMTIIRREHWDPTNETLYPVDERDLEETRLREDLSEENQTFLGTVFLEGDEKLQREWESDENLQAISRQQERRIRIKRAGRYRDAIRGLYQVFRSNSIPWETVNTAYLDKFYDIYEERTETEEASGRERKPEKGQNGEGDSLEALELRFGSFEEKLRYGVIPLWNIERLSFDGRAFMVPCVDGSCYEHEFWPDKGKEGDGYLIQTNQEILEIRHEKERIVLKSKKETFEGWQILHMVQGEILRSLDYDAPLLTNHRKDSFLRRYSRNSQAPLMTKADLFRRILELDIGEFIEIQDCEIRDCEYQACEVQENREEYPARGGTGWQGQELEQEVLFPMDSRKQLVLKFKEKNPGYYLNEGIMDFAVAWIQREVSEYRCVGEREKKENGCLE